MTSSWPTGSRGGGGGGRPGRPARAGGGGGPAAPPPARAAAGDDEPRADGAVPPPRGGPRLRHVPGGQRDGRDAHRDVDPEDAAPAGRVDERAADDRADRKRQAEHRAPQADRLRPLGGVGEHVGDDRHRYRVEHAAAHGLQGPERDQPAEPGSEGAGERAEGEQGEAELEDSSPADPGGDRSRQHQQAGQDEQVGVDRPLQPGDGRAQVPSDRRQRHVDDRDVHADDEQAQAADGQHQVAALAAQLRHGSLRQAGKYFVSYN